MANTLVFFTPRSGSSYVNDLLSLQHNNINLDEFIHSRVRGSYFDRLPKDVKLIVSQLQQRTIFDYKDQAEAAVEFNKRVRSVDFMSTARGISLKCIPVSPTIPVQQFIQHCIDKQYEVYFVYRSVEHQVYSFLCSRIRAAIAEQNNIPNETAFVNFKNAKAQYQFEPLEFPIKQALVDMENLQRYWRVWISYNTVFKNYVKTFSYEQFLTNPLLADIQQQTIDNYNSRNDVIQPSNIGPVGSLITNWDQIVEYIKPLKLLHDSLEV